MSVVLPVRALPLAQMRSFVDFPGKRFSQRVVDCYRKYSF